MNVVLKGNIQVSLTLALNNETDALTGCDWPCITQPGGVRMSSEETEPWATHRASALPT